MTAIALLVACLQQAPTMDAEAGFQGKVFPDSWTRINVLVTYEGEPLDAELRIKLLAGIAEPIVYRRPLRLIRKARMRLGYDVYLSSRNYVAEVELVSKGKVLQQMPLAFGQLTSSLPRLLCVGNPPDLILEGMAKKPPVTLVRLPSELLPPTALSLTSVDRILIPEPFPLEVGQETALREWVRQGGTLIFGAGRSTHLRQNPFWRELCPMESPELGSISVPSKNGDLPLTVVRGAMRRGRSSFTVGGMPLVLRAREGAGEVVFLPLLLDQANFAKALPSADLLAEVLDLPPPPKEEQVKTRKGFLTRTPEWQLEGKVLVVPREMTDALRKVLPPEFSPRFGALVLAVVGMIAYIALIGPVEYLRLRRRGQLRTGWRSFGILVLVFGSLTAVWSTLNSTRETKLTVVSLLDEDRVRTYGVFRPARGGTFEVAATGPLTPLAPARPFGTVDTPDPITVSLPSEARLPTPTAATRLLVAQRPLAEGEGSLSAEWATADRKSVKIRHAGSFPLEECWAVSKEFVWPLKPIAADSTSTQELTKPMSFVDWGSMLLKEEKIERLNPYSDDPWRRLSVRRTGLVLSFDEALHSLWVFARERTKYRLYERGVDLTSTLERGGVVIVGSFDRNLSTFRCTPDVPMKSYGWARARIREGNR